MNNLGIDSIAVDEVISSIKNNKPIKGLTHDFYRYPARFSNLFARTIIKKFTEPGDLIIDPFMGSGTTIVEARLLGRQAVGTDINSLATFIAEVKSTPLFDEDFNILEGWATNLSNYIKMSYPPIRPFEWIKDGYQKNINNKNTWRIRKSIEQAISYADTLPFQRQQRFARCVILNTSQWALDCRKEIPTVKEFRKKLSLNFWKMLYGAKEYSIKAKEADYFYGSDDSLKTTCLNRSVIGIEKEPIIMKRVPKLILTSPPYPGVHILYHRWQVQGRKETPAPYWITNCYDGSGASYYNMGDRHQKNLDGYFQNLYSSFYSISKICDKNTLIVQMVAFSDPSWQLFRYLETMKKAGFKEIGTRDIFGLAYDRLWREVPNRKWYAENKGKTSSSKEVVLFHQLK